MEWREVNADILGSDYLTDTCTYSWEVKYTTKAFDWLTKFRFMFQSQMVMHGIYRKAQLNNSAIKWGVWCLWRSVLQSIYPQPITGPLLAHAPGLQPRLPQWLILPWPRPALPLTDSAHQCGNKKRSAWPPSWKSTEQLFCLTSLHFWNLDSLPATCQVAEATQLNKLSFLHNRCSVLLLIITPCWCAKRQRISLLLNPNLK